MITNNEQLREFVERINGNSLINVHCLIPSIRKEESKASFKRVRTIGQRNAAILCDVAEQATQALTYAMGEIDRANKVISNLMERNNDYENQIYRLKDELTRIKNIGVEELAEIIANKAYSDQGTIDAYTCKDAAQAVLDFINKENV